MYHLSVVRPRGQNVNSSLSCFTIHASPYICVLMKIWQEVPYICIYIYIPYIYIYTIYINNIYIYIYIYILIVCEDVQHARSSIHKNPCKNAPRFCVVRLGYFAKIPMYEHTSVIGTIIIAKKSILYNEQYVTTFAIAVYVQIHVRSESILMYAR